MNTLFIDDPCWFVEYGICEDSEQYQLTLDDQDLDFEILQNLQILF